MLIFWLGFMTAAYVFLVGAGVYAGWRYVFQPWRVMRTDMKVTAERLTAQDKKIEDVVGSIRVAKTASLSDAELASIERRLRGASLARVEGRD